MDLKSKKLCVAESFLTVSGKMGCILECFDYTVSVESKLIASNGLKWTVTMAQEFSARNLGTEIQKRAHENHWMAFHLIPEGHNERPAPGEFLTLET